MQLLVYILSLPVLPSIQAFDCIAHYPKSFVGSIAMILTFITAQNKDLQPGLRISRVKQS
jgi:hypothetical protein